MLAPFAALCLVGAAHAAPAPSPRERVSFVAVGEQPERAALPFKTARGTATAVFELLPRDEDSGQYVPQRYRLTVPRVGGFPRVLEVCDDAWLGEAGAVDVEGGHDSLFFTCEARPMSMSVSGVTLGLLDPASGSLVTLELTLSRVPDSPESDAVPSKNYREPSSRKAREFLGAVKFDYGYEDARTLASSATDRGYAEYFWRKDNAAALAALAKGPAALKARRYKGRVWTSGRAPAAKRGDVGVVANVPELSSVVAFDEKTGEEFILFDPGYKSEAAVRGQGGRYVFIAEGAGLQDLLIVNLDTFRARVYADLAGGEEVGPVESGGGKLRAAGKELPLPDF